MPLWVINRTMEDHRDSYGGTEYEFPMGVAVEVPEIVAQELFGYGVEDKAPFVVRLGWSATANDMKRAIAKLAKFEITDTNPLDEGSLSPALERVPPPAGRQPRQRSGATHPVVAA